MPGEITRWHVGKEIPIALIATIFIQTGAGVWWAAGISHDLSYVKADVLVLRAKVDALIDTRVATNEAFATINGDLQRNIDHNAEQDRRILDLESRLRAVEMRR